MLASRQRGCPVTLVVARADERAVRARLLELGSPPEVCGVEVSLDVWPNHYLVMGFPGDPRKLGDRPGRKRKRKTKWRRRDAYKRKKKPSVP
jgi:hypothetical protein